MSLLEKLKTHTTVVADTGDFESLKTYAPTDATTNPSLILVASQLPQYKELIQQAKRSSRSSKELLIQTFVHFGLEILKIIPGRVSTEVDARLSFDQEGSVETARQIIALYEAQHIPRERVLIKLASTWEGILAARVLEQEKIHCNMTLLFALPQAIACGEAKATLISPFVGRILDWHKKNDPGRTFLPHEDPGVLSVQMIYNYFKKFEVHTQIMGASFRNKEEVLELAGCDLLTISPKILEELKNTSGHVEKKLSLEKARESSLSPLKFDEKTFRYQLNEDGMASEKLGEGIRHFVEDIVKLETFLHSS